MTRVGKQKPKEKSKRKAGITFAASPGQCIRLGKTTNLRKPLGKRKNLAFRQINKVNPRKEAKERVGSPL